MNGKLMKERRKELGMTQMDLAVRMGVQLSNVSSWERGARTASVPNLRKLAGILGVNMEELLADEPETAAV